jgi:putative transposase
MTEGLKRYYGHGHLHFVTFSCFHRQPLLGTPSARKLFINELARARNNYGFLLVGYVVMPEHVHLLIGEPKRGTPSTMLQMLKQRVSHKMREEHRSESSARPHTQRRYFWQIRFYDFNVHSDPKRKEKLEYMHRNPVTRGLVEHPKDWPWSSWSFYENGEPGLVAIDVVP